ncbi:uncharacterized protein LOC112595576 [Melanaphis sacchari]|uniref:uncharacterized protein LOC112595576 n=1 Tax=Melanaphis sacchari TaxID=742174 RepID=UPI000DC13326|nr:uncharacterized protein LOC112595576 [Melanaphis sacchari]
MTTLATETTSTVTEATVELSNSDLADRSASTVASATSSSSVAAMEVDVVSVSAQMSESDEIVNISRAIRNALECPICLTLMSIMSCYCPNGHAVCESCMLTLVNMNNTQEKPCPLCRTPMMQSLSSSAAVDKLTELARLVKVKCTYAPYGCTELIYVRYVNEHESRCPHVPNVACQVNACQWLGMYEQLYEHVSNSHPGVAIQTSANRLNVTNVNDITTNRRRTYLVRSTYGMMWVLLSRISRSRIQTALFLVKNQPLESDNNHVNLLPTNIVYRVTWFDANDRSRTRSRTKGVNWSTSLKPDSQNLSPNAYTTSRSRFGRMEINWYRILCRWVPKQLTDVHITQRVNSGKIFLEHLEMEGEEFLLQIVTREETWFQYVSYPKLPLFSCKFLESERESIQVDAVQRNIRLNSNGFYAENRKITSLSNHQPTTDDTDAQ